MTIKSKSRANPVRAFVALFTSMAMVAIKRGG